jgi:oligoribonuclease
MTEAKIKPDNNNLVWLDLEMTGLNPDQDKIIEIATIITDRHLNVIAEGPVLAIYQADEILNAMDEWNTKQHTKTGLVKRVRESTVNEEAAETLTLEFIKNHVPPNRSPICGNSICQDRRFLFRHMPKLEQYFHYRNLDVSTVKELAKHWVPEVAKKFKKKSVHRALDDVKESIEELKFYRETIFRLE